MRERIVTDRPAVPAAVTAQTAARRDPLGGNVEQWTAGGSPDGESPFGNSGGGGDEAATAVHPPKIWLVVAAVLIGISLLALPIFANVFLVHVGGYLVSGWLAVTAVAVFSRIDNARQQNPYYSPEGSLSSFVPILSVLAVLVASGHVFFIATELARR